MKKERLLQANTQLHEFDPYHSNHYESNIRPVV